MAYDYEGRGTDYTRDDGSTFHVPVDTDVADAPLAFQDFAESIPFSEYVNVVTINGGTRGTQVVEEEDNGKMLFVTADTTLDFSNITSEGFTVAAVADADATITFSGTNNDGPVEEYKVATVVRVNGTNILSVAGEVSNAGCPECPECPEYPDTPSAAVISGATADDPLFPVNTFSFTGNGTNGDDGQAYDVYEFLGSGQLVVDEPGLVDALIVGGGGGSAGMPGAGGGGVNLLTDAYLPQASMQVLIGAGGAKGDNLNMADNGEPSSLAVKPVEALWILSPGGAASKNTGGTSVGNSGASGAGGGENNTNSSFGGPGIFGVGNRGGDSVNSGGCGAGGGGAGSAGATIQNTDSFAGDGGDARIVTITGEELHVGAGGGGGSNSIDRNGKGGEGAGDGGHYTTAAQDGGPNSGGGAGGIAIAYGAWGTNASGGSGIVIIRVKVSSPSFGPKTRSAVRTAHAARVENGVVRQVIVIPHLDDDDTKITEYCNRIGLPGTWVDTSYTGSRRGKYAGVGDSFDVKARSGDGEFVSPPAPATTAEQDTMIIDDKEQPVKRRRRK